jgi:hypothetical protein
VAQDLDSVLGRYRCGAQGGREKHLRREYGISQASYDDLLRSQGGVCAICHQPESRPQPLSVDHDHATGRVRGLLCDNCNIAIGKMGDEPNRLRAAATYLDHGGSAGAQHQPPRR